MTDLSSNAAHVRAALFVDFDNIYLGLQNEDPRAAEQFATHPGRWLRWLQESLPASAHRPRKILLRRCYLNPSQFSRFRPYFIRSAFEVMDCPPLTRGGKTSADIQMVMDIMDALGHVTRFDEFIILSGDADFTPLLLRLSRHDRQSVVLAAGPASAAYKAACDHLIDQDTFLEEAIGIADSNPVRPGADSELLQRIAARVFERAAGNGDLVATDLPGIFREFAEFTPDSNWLGFYSLRGMTNAVVQARPDLEMIEGDPWRVRVRSGGGEPPDAGAPGPGGAAQGGGEASAEGARPNGAAAGLAGAAAAEGAMADDAATAARYERGLPAALGGGLGEAALPGTASPQLLRTIADKVHARTSVAGELLATDLPGVYREFPQFTPNSNWLGFYSLRGLSDAVIRTRTDLAMVDGDPWRVRLKTPTGGGDAAGRGAALLAAAAPAAASGEPGGGAAEASHGEGARRRAGGGPGSNGGGEEPAAAPPEDTGAGAAAAAASAAPPAPPTPEDEERQHQVDAILDFVRNLVASSDSPVPTVRAAQAAIGRFGEGVLASRWYGAGSFRDFLARQTDLGFSVSTTRPGYLYDPDLHQTPLGGTPAAEAEDPEIGDPETTALAHRIHRITDTPYLTPEQYALVFREIAEEVNAEGYFLTRTSKAVRDRCIEEGTPVPRTSVNFILRGIAAGGHSFEAGHPSDPEALAGAFLKNVLGLCESAGIPLSDEEAKQLEAWIVGGTTRVAT